MNSYCVPLGLLCRKAGIELQFKVHAQCGKTNFLHLSFIYCSANQIHLKALESEHSEICYVHFTTLFYSFQSLQALPSLLPSLPPLNLKSPHFVTVTRARGKLHPSEPHFLGVLFMAEYICFLPLPKWYLVMKTLKISSMQDATKH